MIPIRLELTNFLSYRTTAELDFAGIQLACISGMNGAGKSSILDAMTWALFGKSRSKSDDDIVNRIAAREGEEAQVVFDFSLENVIYRVIRRKKHSRTMTLEFQIAADYEASKWKSLTMARRRETDSVIETLLRMNYDTFSNASFLLQGKADEFTMKTAGQRKEILADLLGVNEWNNYREAVSKRRKEEENRTLLIDGQMGDIELELAQEDARKAAYEAAHAEHRLIKQELQTKEQLLTQTRQTAELINQQKKQVHSLALALERAQKQLSNLQTNHEKQQAERAGYTAVLEQAAEIEQQQQAWQAADAAVRGWQEKADAFNKLQNEKRPFELTIAQTKSRLEQQLASLQSQEKRVVAMQTEQTQVQAQLTQTQAAVAELTQKLQAFTADEQAFAEARTTLQTLESERNLLRQEHGQLQKQAQQAEKLRIEHKQVTQNFTSTTTGLDRLTAEIAALESQQEELGRVQNQISALEAEQPLLKEQMNQIKERMDRLEAAAAEDACPLCGQPLSAEHKAAVLAELQSDGKDKGDRFRTNRTTLPALEKQVATLTTAVQQRTRLEQEKQAQQQKQAVAEARLTEVNRLLEAWEKDAAARFSELTALLADESALTTQQKLVNDLQQKLQGKAPLEQKLQQEQRTLSQAEARLAEIERAVQEWQSTGVAELSTAQTQLSTDSYEPEARAALAKLDEQAAAVGYEPEAHEASKTDLAALKEAPERFRQLEKAQTVVKTLDDSLANLASQMAEQTAEVTQRELEHQEAETALKALVGSGEIDLNTLEDEVQKLREAEAAANRKVGRAQQSLDVLTDLRRRKKQLTAERSEITQLITRLKRLEKACGRDGVQALLIEQALPEIEERANELLERLTDGRMRVEFETQKQLKSKKDTTVETLDIRIADESGVRPYENFSGGEQFRVNFAIRIALSQILAKRAGARLQTLVIDEGFGSQDPDGRQRLIEAIRTIQDDFKCILVITHILALQEAFPTQINVTKSTAGSRIFVNS